MTTHWGDFVFQKSRTHTSFVLGIDPALKDIPLCFKSNTTSPVEILKSYLSFLLETAGDLIGFIKPQSAYYEAFGSEGVKVLADLVKAAKQKGMGVILDAKRGDIGSTAAAYAQAYLTPDASDLEVDCLTINPFLGPETLEPFVDCARKYGKGLFVLVKTSNPGAGWLQDKKIDGARVSDRVAECVAAWAEETKGSSGLSSIGAVVGATMAEDGQRLRKIMPDSLFLAPGLGAQGGKAEDINILKRPDGSGVLVPVSRGIARFDDLGLSTDAYAVLIRERIAGFKAALG